MRRGNDGGERLIRIRIESIAYETDAAYLVRVHGEEIWMPKSVVALHDEEDIIEVPEWLARKHGL